MDKTKKYLSSYIVNRSTLFIDIKNLFEMYQYVIKPFMFLFSPEFAHSLTIKLLRFSLMIPGIKLVFKRLYQSKDKKLGQNIWGINFPNPVGLAAGFDKDGKYFQEMAHLGFGFIEIGTVTPLPQDGNEKPRLFRLPSENAIINRMGFNNDGVVAMVERLKNKKNKKNKEMIIGGNIGKNKNTPNENATQDYLICFHALYEYLDYFVVNVSSPNTPGLRELQEKEPLTNLLKSLMDANLTKPSLKPVLLKIAPDLTNEQLDDIIEIVFTTNINGIIATNTTIDRGGLKVDTSQIGNGGLSGRPLKNRSTEVIKYLHTKSEGKIKIIGVGGIESPQDAIEKLDAGACLVQVYSGLIYSGPSLVKEINDGILMK